MACHSRGEYGGALSPDNPHSTRLHCFDSSAEWRSREHLEPSLPSTAPAYWDSDDEENCSSSSIVGPRPSDLYGKFTWKIENFSEISKRELRSNVFEVGGYKWYILVYPQGCDVCNHLSLFLCVADYDKLLPGWSHFAQFTIAVVNKDPKKSKYSDTLHRFCKKEHDWGWKKFMELSKVLDGFTVADTLVIKAQVQVIRENAHRPFRCLDCQYRRELVRVYLTNVEGICRRFVEEKREKLGKLMEDTSRWASFRTFWSAVEEGARYRLAREKTDVILKAVVKRFFNEKEVTSTLVMDALYSGCKALDYRSRNKKGKTNEVDMNEARPVVWVDKDVFVLAGDVLVLLERSVTESLPPCKDDKGPQNRTKDVGSGDDSGKDSVERDEHRLTELGRRTVEMFVLAHLYTNRVEVAYREAVALKRQEELIREEEAAGLAEMEMRVKREAAEKEKRLKKKQAKQRRKDRKEKDKEAEEKKMQVEQGQHEFQGLLSKTVLADPLHNECNVFSPPASLEACEDDGDLSGLDPIDDVGTLGPGVEDGDIDHTGWERRSSCAHNGMEAGCSGVLLEETTSISRNTRTPQATLDDSSSTCSSDSLPQTHTNLNEAFVTTPGLLEQSHVLPSSEENQVDSEIFDMDQQCIEAENMLRVTGVDVNGTCEPSSSSCSVGVDSETVIVSLKDRVRWLEQRLFEKEEEVVMLQEQLSLFQHQMGRDRPSSLLVEEATNFPCRIQSHDVVSVDLGRGETSPSLIQSPAGEGFDWGKTSGAALARSGRDDGHSGFLNENGSLSKLPFLPGQGGNNIRSSGYMPTLAKPDTLRMTNTTSRSRSVESSRPPRILTTPISGFTMAMPASISGDEDTSLMNSLPSTAAGIGLSISRPSSAPSSVTGACPNIPLFSSCVHPSQPLARSMSVGAGRLVAGTEPRVGTHVTPSYKNATIGKTRPPSTAALAPLCVAAYPNVSVGFSGPTSCVKTSSHLNSSCYSQAMAVPTTSVLSSSPLSTPASQMGAFPGQSLPVISNSMEGGSLFIPPVISSTAGGLRTPLSVMETLVPSHILPENSGVRNSTNGHPSVDITFGTVTLELLQDDSVEAQSLLNQPHDELDQKQHHSEHQQLQQPGSHSNILRFTTAQQQVLHQHHLQGPSPKMNRGPGLSIIRLATRSVTTAEHVNSGAVMSEEFPHLDIINNLLDEDQTNQILQHKGSSGYNLSYGLVPTGPSCMDGHNHNFCQVPSHRANDVPGGERVDRIRAAENGEEQTCNGLRDCVLMNAPFQHPPLAHLHSQQSLDGVSSHLWPVGNGAITSGNNNNKGLNNSLVDSHLLYSLVQGHHLAVPDSSIFALGHNGYKVYTPAPQQP